MVALVAWRNIWRNKLRSLVVMAAIALGLWAAIFSSSIGNGVNMERISSIVESQTSHIQIHKPGFTENYESALYVDNASVVIERVEQQEDIVAFSPRTVATGIVSSASAGLGVRINGVVPEKENELTKLKEKLTKGEYFSGIRRNPILVGHALAEELNLDIRKKVVLNFQNAQNDIISATFRVAGIYRTQDARNDKMSVFVLKEDLDKLLELDNTFHELAIYTEDKDEVDATMSALKPDLEDLSVQSWKDLMPWLQSVDIIGRRGNYLLLGIILLALSFGIVNTMLMSVLERVREFGMLLAVGMNKRRLFTMIFLETAFLMLTATPFGILLGYFCVEYFAKNGIDLSSYSEGLQNVGLNPMIYPHLDKDYYVMVIILVVIAAFIAALYPARRALRLNPSQALRKI